MKLSLNVSQRKEKDDFFIDVPNDFYNAKFVDGEIYYEKPSNLPTLFGFLETLNVFILSTFT